MIDPRAAAAHFVDELAAAITPVLEAGAGRIARQAQASAPVLRTPHRGRIAGELRAAITVQSPPSANVGDITESVVVNTAAAPYARFPDLGFRATGRRSVSGGPFHGVARGGRFVRGSHFLERAFGAHKLEIAEAVEAAAQAEVDKVDRT